MYDFTGAKIEKLIIHSIGNKLKESEVILSENGIDISEGSLHNILGDFFFGKFRNNRLYHFNHEADLAFNEVYQFIKLIFNDLNNFESKSRNIARHLYEVSTHPNIKVGELCITFITGATLNEVVSDAIGIFKSETKDPFLQTNNNEKGITIDWEQGMDIKKLDKGCIIFNKQVENGYKTLLFDSGSSADTKYWKEDFLGVKESNNDFAKTKLLIDACKRFVNEDYSEEKVERVAMLNNVMDYINVKSSVVLEDFTTHVTKDESSSEKLKGFINDYAKKRDCGSIGTFSIDQSAVKNIKRSMKNNIKLDTDIEIKINTSPQENKQYLEKGYDNQKQMYYYKIYFNEEK